MSTDANSGDLALAEIGDIVSTFCLSGVDGADPIVLPGIFAVGGGGRPVL